MARRRPLLPFVPLLVTSLTLTACRASAPQAPSPQPSPPEASAPQPASPPIVQPGAPGAPGRVLTADEAQRLEQPRPSDADVRFMQAMIAHHAQAVEMTDLLRTRTRSEAMRDLGERIAVSQADEIAMMRDWLERRGAPVSSPEGLRDGQAAGYGQATGADAHAHHAAGVPMAGMLTADEMARLAAATGPAFDRLFLEYMIRHHQGALVMVKDLFASPGAGQDTEIYAFASDVDADQRMEIARMAALLKELQR